jgi:hypothetical protein
VDDLLIAARDLGETTGTLENAHKFKLKGVGPLTYHLGCDYFRDKDVTQCYGPCKYIARYCISLRICLKANQRNKPLHWKREIILKLMKQRS